MSKATTKQAVRLSYANLLEPRAQDNEKPDVLTYGTALLIPKENAEDVKAIKAAIKAAVEEGAAKKWGGKVPKNLKNPLRDGDEEREDDDTYKGMFFINGKGPRGGKEAPILLDKNGAETTDASIIYSGVMARVALQFYAFDVNGNRGIACGITSVLSQETGEPLGNVVTAKSARDEFGITTPASAAAAGFADSDSDDEDEEDDDTPWG